MPKRIDETRRDLAARLVAEDWLNDEDIASKCGIARDTLARWKRTDQFKALINEHLKDFREAARRKAIASVEHRVAKADDRWKRLHEIMAERAIDPGMQAVPGGKSGLLTRTIKGIGSGDDFQIVEEYAVDATLLREIREHEKQAAQELGQWEERSRAVSDESEKPRLVIPDVDDRPDTDADEFGPAPDAPG